jgi:hypothetical protein
MGKEGSKMKTFKIILVLFAILVLSGCNTTKQADGGLKEDEVIVENPTDKNNAQTGLNEAYSMDLDSLIVDESLQTSEFAMYAHEGAEFVKALEDGTITVTPEHYFKHDKSSGEIYGYSHEAPYDEIRELIIPSMINENVVTGIRYNSFSAMDLERVVLPDTIKTIGDGAFEANNLTELHLPHGLEEIGKSAFQINRLTEIILPNSVTKIDEKAFNSNDIKEIYLGTDLMVGGFKVFDWNKVDVIVNESSLTLKNIGYMLDIENGADQKQTGTIDRGNDPIKIVSKLN